MISVVLPYLYDSQPLRAQIDDVRAQGLDKVDMVVLKVCDGPVPTMAADLLVAQVRPANLAALYNLGLEECRGPFMLWLPPHVRLEPGALEFLRLALERHPCAAFAYSYYNLNETCHRLLEDIGDITEQRDMGWMKMYRTQALREAGGWDEALNHAAEYDLNLRLMSWGDSALVPRPLYRLEAPDAAPEHVEIGASTHALPQARGHSVFAYLQYGEAQEKEVEAVFARWLQAKGAWLHEPRGSEYDAGGEGDTPLVSVVIPCRNRVRYVCKAVESALAQTYRNLEVLLIDNGSTDGSPEAVEALGSDRVRVIRNDGQTIASALNRGWREAKGVFMSQLDSDDLYLPHTVATAVETLRAQPEAGLAVSYYQCIDDQDNPLEALGVVKHLEYSQNNILRVNGAGAVRVWRRGVIEELGGFDEGPLASYGEDYDLLLRVIERYPLARIHDVLYLYRRHDDNTDAVRDALDNVRLKTLARWRAIGRRVSG